MLAIKGSDDFLISSNKRVIISNHRIVVRDLRIHGVIAAVSQRRAISGNLSIELSLGGTKLLMGFSRAFTERSEFSFVLLMARELVLVRCEIFTISLGENARNLIRIFAADTSESLRTVLGVGIVN